MKKLYLVLFFALLHFAAWAQLSLAPTAVYLDKYGIGNLYVSNNSGVAQEISVSFQFGYSDQDSAGTLIMRYDDSTNARDFGLNPYLKAFPRTFILPPNQQQIVRLQARVPKGKAPGVLFTRIKVVSSPQTQDIGTTDDTTGIATRVSLRFEQVIVAFFKNGDVNTGVQINKVESKVDSNLLSMDFHYKTTGNAPYLGQVRMTIKDAAGKVLSENRNTVALYFTGRRRFFFTLPEGSPRDYFTADFVFETLRNDIPSEDLIQAPPIKHQAVLVPK